MNGEGFGVAVSVSIGLPVYNGERFLAEAIADILAQDHADFELIISDNASTDGTEAICRRFAAQDRRVSYRRAPENRGAAWNFNETVRLARHGLFKWAAHDDRLEPGFVGACVRALESAPTAVLAYTQAVEIDDQGRELRPYRARLSRSTSPHAHERFRELCGDEHNCFPIFGVIRTAALRRTPLIGAYVGSDRVLLAELGLAGPFCEVDQPLFRHREHVDRSTRALPLHQRAQWFDPRLAGRRIMPYWRFLREYTAATWRAPLTAAERVRCWVELLRWVKRYRHRLYGDVRLRLSGPPAGARREGAGA